MKIMPEKSKLKVLISSKRLVKKIKLFMTTGYHYPDFIDTQYPDMRIVFYGYKMCEKLGDYFYRHDIVNYEPPKGEYCEICQVFVPGFEYIGCCSGFECGCMGKPIEPCICSTECWEVLCQTK